MKTGKERRERYQSGIVGKWRESGLTQAEFCRQEGIAEWALSEWKRRELRVNEAVAREHGAVDKSKQRYGLPPKDRKDLESFWKRVIGEQTKSSLTPAEFCKKQGLRVHTFRRWRKRFVGAKQEEENPFVAVKLSTAGKPIDDAIEIILPGGSTVQVTECTPLDLLCELLRKLEAEC